MNKNIKVLHVLGELKPSGAESMFCVAAPLFCAEGVNAEIVATGPNLGIYAPELAKAGYKLHHIPFSKSLRFFISLYRLMRAGKYDVLHLHTEQAGFWIGLVALAVRPARVLHTIHSNFSFRGNLRLRRMIQRRILHILGVVHVAISPSVARTELMHFGLKTRLVPNWYDNNRFYSPSAAERNQARKSLDIASDETVLVSIGNCSEVKNHAALIKAVALLPAELRPLYLHAGIEEEGHPERRLAEQLGVAEHIRFLGPLTDVRPVLYAADLFAMPSFVEGFGIAAVEALATGLPAVFTDVPGLRDFRSAYEGLCYATPDSDALCSSLAVLLTESSEQRRARSIDYPSISQQLFGIASGVSGYIQIYRGN